MNKLIIIIFTSLAFISCEKSQPHNIRGVPTASDVIYLIEGDNLIMKKDYVIITHSNENTIEKTFFVPGEESGSIYYFMDEKCKWISIKQDRLNLSMPFERQSFQITEDDGTERTLHGFRVPVAFNLTRNTLKKDRQSFFHLLSSPSGTRLFERKVKIIQEGK